MNEIATTKTPQPAVATNAADAEVVRTHALREIAAHTRTLYLVTPSVLALEHAEIADKWARLAREYNASETDIADAYQEGHSFIYRFGDDGA